MIADASDNTKATSINAIAPEMDPFTSIQLMSMYGQMNIVIKSTIRVHTEKKYSGLNILLNANSNEPSISRVSTTSINAEGYATLRTINNNPAP